MPATLPADISPSLRDKVIEKERDAISSSTFNSLVDEPLAAEIVSRIQSDISTDETNRQSYLETLSEIIDMYEGRRTGEKSYPFEKCADVRTMLVASHVELLHSSLLPVVWNLERLRFRPRENSDSRRADHVTEFMRWALPESDFDRYADLTTYNHILEGTVVTKVRWDITHRWVQRRILKQDAIRKRIKSLGESDRLTLPSAVNDFDTKYDFTTEEKPIIEDVHLDDVFFPTYAVPSGSVDDIDHIAHRTRPTLSDLRRKVEMGLFVEDAVEHIISKQEEKNSSTKGTSAFATNSTVPTGIVQEAIHDAEGTIAPNSCFELIEHYAIWDIPGKGPVDCVTWIERQTGTFLGMLPLVNLWGHGRRPWRISQLVPRHSRLYGKGVGHFLVELEKINNTIVNQRLDMGTMSVIPPLLYRAASTFNPDDIEIAPGVSIPVDSMDDAKFLQMPNNTLTSFQEERTILERAERLTSIGDLQAGQNSTTARTRATARGTLALIARGDIHTNTLGSRIRRHLSGVIELILLAWQDKMPEGLSARILNDQGEQAFPRGLTPSEISGRYDIYSELDPTGGSIQGRLDNVGQAYTMGINNPLIASNPAHLWELTALPLRELGLDVEALIGPKPIVPDITTNPVMSEINEITQGRLPVTSKTSNPIELLIGLFDWSQTDEAKDLPPEKRAILRLRLEALQAEVRAKARQEMLNSLQSGMGPEPTGTPLAPGLFAPGAVPIEPNAPPPTPGGTPMQGGPGGEEAPMQPPPGMEPGMMEGAA